jgi:hypothetical protein
MFTIVATGKKKCVSFGNKSEKTSKSTALLPCKVSKFLI